MDGQEYGGVPAKKRRGAKVRRDEPHEVHRQKRTLVLSDEAWKSLSVYALMTNADRSELVEKAIHVQYRGFVVQDRRRDAGLERSTDEASEVEDSAATLPVGEPLPPLEVADGDPRPGAGERSRRRNRHSSIQAANG